MGYAGGQAFFSCWGGIPYVLCYLFVEMSSSRGHIRCISCRMHAELCICSFFQPFRLSTKVTVFIHHREYWKISNTGHLATLALENASVTVLRQPVDYGITKKLLHPDYLPVVLFPNKEAEVLTGRQEYSKPLQLIVPDGSWRQARKMIFRNPYLRDLPRIALPVGEPSIYRLRKESRPEGMATFEAIARVLGILEGSQVQSSLERGFEAYTDRVLWTRGKKKTYLKHCDQD